ncbi:SLAP domain-containing protein [Agrilactobacillus fermenti]|uniref:SLAP domain-containing protein n=1 Tax=Agrilactobacillus fermenti TaxID=2586909 RepID=UPI001E624DD1|nr:SLAP domain-containing protein [Agrilactobacillus fermenti]MCD2255827.1 hypothetical protein [Agrilactobacillus fermenti]
MRRTRFVTLLLSGVMALGLFTFSNTTIDQAQAATTVGYVNYIPDQGIPVYQVPNGAKTGQYLPTGTAWQINGSRYDAQSGTWFNVGTNQWVQADYIVNQSNIAYDNGVAFNYAKTIKISQPTTVYMMPNGYPTQRILNSGSTWQTVQVTTVHDGSLWYNIGTNQWIPAKGTFLTN